MYKMVKPYWRNKETDIFHYKDLRKQGNIIVHPNLNRVDYIRWLQWILEKTFQPPGKRKRGTSTLTCQSYNNRDTEGKN